MDIDTATNSVEGDDTSFEDTAANDTGVETQDDSFEDSEGTQETEQAEAEDEDELDIDGHKLKLPKALAEKLNAERLMQADYTRKTQELANYRKAFEAERDSFQQASTEELEARTNIALVDRQLEAFGKVDWDRWYDDDYVEAQKAFTKFTRLKDVRAEAAANLENLTYQRTLTQQQETAKRLQEGHAELTREIKDWGPATAAKLMDFGTKRYGFSPEYLDKIDDPRLIRVLHAAHQWDEYQSKQKKAQTLAKQTEIQPAATTTRKGTAPPQGLDDRLSADEWLKRRNAQLRKG